MRDDAPADTGAQDERVDDTQWTGAALEAYRDRVRALTDALAVHADLVAARVGRQGEIPDYIASAEALQRAVDDFAEAEFDWCGSFPVRSGDLEDDEDGDGDGDDGEDDEHSSEQPGVMTVLGRYDYLVTDEAALVAHGRAAFLQHWERETDEDAREHVQDAVDAVRELLHGAALAELEDVPGLQLTAWVSQFIQHEGSTEEEVAEDPFGIAGARGVAPER